MGKAATRNLAQNLFLLSSWECLEPHEGFLKSLLRKDQLYKLCWFAAANSCTDTF